MLTDQISAGQLGIDPVQVEAILKSAFKIAGRWGAIILLDEADVFVAQRSTADAHRNALVSVFLRELEYYKGILFLTTNRVETFDEALISRIHFGVLYEPLGKVSRRVIWKYFLDKATTGQGEAAYDQLLDYLACKDLNGREVRPSVLQWEQANIVSRLGTRH